MSCHVLFVLCTIKLKDLILAIGLILDEEYVRDSEEMSDVECNLTRGQQEGLDVVGVEDTHQIVERAQEPGAGVPVGPHKLIHSLKALFGTLHLNTSTQTQHEQEKEREKERERKRGGERERER